MMREELSEIIRITVQEVLSQLGYNVDGNRSKGEVAMPYTVPDQPSKGVNVDGRSTKGVVYETVTGGNVDAVPSKGGMTAYEKTEALLSNYCAFQRIIGDRMEEVEEIKTYGVPKAITYDNVPHAASKGGIRLPEVSVEVAVQKVLESIRGTVDAIALVNKGMDRLKCDPYYQILPMRYFEGRTQEDIAYELGCSQKTISQNKCRLINELAMQLFPGQVADEMMAL